MYWLKLAQPRFALVGQGKLHCIHLRSAFGVVSAQLTMEGKVQQLTMEKSSSSPIDTFCGKYYFNDDRRYNFVAAQQFDSEDEKLQMIKKFKPSVPKAREDMPALKIMMRKPGASSDDDLFVHDTLYNIEIKDQGKDKVVMSCWTGDMQLTVDGKISTNQAEGKTVITLDRAKGKASMDIGGGFGQEKWVMTFKGAHDWSEKDL